MKRRSTLWLLAAVAFTAINVAGAPVAASEHQFIHSTAHVLLALVGGLAVWYLVRRDSRSPAERGRSSEIGSRLTNIEQAVDAMAIEVERIGEGQRFMTRLFTEEGSPSVTDADDRAPAREPDTPDRPPVRPSRGSNP